MTHPALLDEHRLKVAMATWDTSCGKRLRDRRQALNISQTSLADAIAKRVTTISKYELGIVTPSDSARHALACVLMCEVADIWPPLDREYVLAVARAEAVAA